MSDLDPIMSFRKAGDELFHRNGTGLSNTLLSFWQWSSSELVGNALRGMLAEYIVAMDLGCTDGVRQEWDAFDLETHDGIKVEVKSAAYLQSWKQSDYSKIQFSIAPTCGWDANTNTSSEQKVRQSDVYVFCLLKHKDKATVDPLNMEQWDFYVVPTTVLNMKLGQQKTLSLSRLLELEPAKVEHGAIGHAITGFGIG
ncbi:hypothetical protein P4B35_22005 [Pontiellaceae bacterium B12227]|nr:hypothetical protein [Pontiellaceae bacterium B12227]